MWLEHNRFVEYRYSVGCLELRGSGYTPMVLGIVKYMRAIENTSWKVLAYGVYARVVDVSEIERVSAANE